VCKMVGLGVRDPGSDEFDVFTDPSIIDPNITDSKVGGPNILRATVVEG
jgi:hypothetical protein